MNKEITKRIENEVKALRISLREHPDRYSAWGKAYWEGNIAGLEWVLELQSSTPKANKQ